MFKKLSGPKVVKRKVTVHIPQDGDGFTKASFYAFFEILPRSENDALMEKFEAGDPDTDWLNRVMKGWEGYVDEDNKEIEFSIPELRAMLDVPYTRIALIQEYFNTANGGAGRRKN